MIVKDNIKITKRPLVTVQVYAYNKEKYIAQCLDSILSQKTNYEYEVIVAENPGTDHTREILLNYQKRFPEKIILVLREKNMGFFYNYFASERLSRGKYIARCDGDDYWCDNLKIQKQVDFLESNIDVGLCYTRSRIFDDNRNCFSQQEGGLPWKGFKSELIKEPIQQPTIMYRRDLFWEYMNEIQPEEKGWLMEDVPRSLWFAWNSKVVRLDDITAVYRIVSDSQSHNIDYNKQERYHRSIRDIRLFYYDKYCKGETNLCKLIKNDYFKRNLNAALKSSRPDAYFINMILYHYENLSEFWENIKTFIWLFRSTWGHQIKSFILRRKP